MYAYESVDNLHISYIRRPEYLYVVVEFRT